MDLCNLGYWCAICPDAVRDHDINPPFFLHDVAMQDSDIAGVDNVIAIHKHYVFAL